MAARGIDAALAAAGLPPLPRTAWLEIDLDAIAANLAAIRATGGSAGARVTPVVKADAYGHGLVPVALALERAGADGLAVATLDEAVALRDAGSAVPLLVLQPIPPVLAPVAAERHIALTLGDRTHVDAVARVLEGARAQADGGNRLPPLRVELEVETGLGRGGMAAESVAAAIERLDAIDGIELDGAWSHLQAPEDAARSRHQVERFERATDRVVRPPVRRHVSASGGLIAGSAPGYDALRPGLAIYGLMPDELLGTAGTVAGGIELRPAMSLRARPVRVADLPVGWGVSYGPTWTATRPSRIATLPLGYGDGWPRALSNRADVLVRGRRVPLVGNVAMDAVMADVTDVPGEAVTGDDVFTLLGRDGGEEVDAHELARLRNTNAWEVVTSMSARLPRVYYLAAVPVGLRTLTSLALTGPRNTWPVSSSGTGISATWRSTRS